LSETVFDDAFREYIATLLVRSHNGRTCQKTAGGPATASLLKVERGNDMLRTLSQALFLVARRIPSRVSSAKSHSRRAIQGACLLRGPLRRATPRRVARVNLEAPRRSARSPRVPEQSAFPKWSSAVREPGRSTGGGGPLAPRRCEWPPKALYPPPRFRQR